MKKLATLFTALTLVSATAFAQYYYVPYINANMNPGGLNTDVEYPSGGGIAAGWTQIQANSATPVWSANQSLPFSFSFNGSAVTQYKVSTTGILTFDVSTLVAAPSSAPIAIPSASIPDQSVVVGGIEGSGANDFIFTKTFGASPNRQYWIQFNSYTIPGGTNYTYWAIMLEETTNNIYIVDQRTATTISTSLGVQINSTTAVSVAGSPAVGTHGTAAADPSDNSYYKFMQGTQPVNSAYLNSLTYPSFVTAPTSVNITGTIMNLGSASITAITVKYLSGVTVYTDNISAISIAPFATYNFTHTTPLSVPTAGSYPVTVWVELTGDADQSDDTLSQAVGALSFIPIKQVVFEEATGTWCGWCPRGAVFMDSLDIVHPSTTCLVAVHNGDPMTVTAYDGWMGTQIGGYPSGVVDRYDIDVDPSTFFSEYGMRIQDIAPCDVTLETGYNASAGTLNIVGHAHFATDLSGDYRFNYVVTEDHVTGVGTTWDQHNYYSYASNNLPLSGAGHNWQNEPNPVLAANMEYNHVGRAIANTAGVTGSLPGTITSGSNLSFNFPAYTIPAGSNVANMNVIVWVQDGPNGRILNASHAAATATGIETPVTGLQSMSLSPNPASGSSALRVNFENAGEVTMDIIDVTGKIVRSNTSSVTSGDYIYNLNLTGLAQGIYNVRVTTQGQSQTQKLVVY